MLRKEFTTAVIPVRSGSKGIPRKNLYRLGRDTLLERTIKMAKLCPFVDRVMVSTDDQEMYAIADHYGAAAPALRPSFLASDKATTVDVVVNLIETAPVEFGWILLLQVTTPLRTLEDTNKFCGVFEKGPADAQGCVSLVHFENPHPDKIQEIEHGYVKSYLERDSSVPRQSLPTVYALNGAFYLTHRNTIMNDRSFLPPRTLPFVMPEERSINLDRKMDLYLLEMLVERGLCKIEEYEL